MVPPVSTARQPSSKNVEASSSFQLKNAIPPAVPSVQTRCQTIATHLNAINREAGDIDSVRIDENAVAQSLLQFDGVWDSLWPAERTKIFGLLLEGIDYD